MNRLPISTRTRFFVSAMALVLGVTPAPASGSEDGLSSPKDGYRVEMGWNLLSLPYSTDLEAIRQHPNVIEAMIATSQGTIIQNSISNAPPKSTGNSAGDKRLGIWVYASKPSKLQVGAKRHHPDVHKNTNADLNWVLVGVDQPSMHDHRNIKRLLHWNPSQGTYEKVLSGQTLVPGQGYWAAYADANQDAPEGPRSNKPAPPLKLTGKPLDGGVRLTWRTPAIFEDGAPIPEDVSVNYTLYRKTMPNGTYQHLTNTFETHFVDHNLLPGTRYRYYLKASLPAAGPKAHSERSRVIDIDIVEGGLQGRPGLAFAEVDSTKTPPHTELVRADAPFEGTNQTNASDRYLEAQKLRDGQVRKETDSETGLVRAYQVEYAEDPNIDARDSQTLAEPERVWVYTQGIALAQRARSADPQDWTRAQELARWLCHYAEHGEAQTRETGTVIQGWHFSRNTKNDNYKDPRLVTGANAWAIYGLGRFVVSKGYKKLQPKEQIRLKRCYLDALAGLEEHRRVINRFMSLMTAGWTTTGLMHARSPSDIVEPIPARPEDPSERWEYYDVLDALGYDSFPEKEEDWPTVRTYQEQESGSGPRTKLPGRTIRLTEEDWNVLRQRVQADNVVTEHNVDTIAVLNHALQNASSLGPEGEAENQQWTLNLRDWRDTVQDGVFELLWDERSWKKDLPEHRLALKQEDLGRIVTGGTIDFSGTTSGGARFSPSPHVAIDNCSWLALSVDYQQLPSKLQEKLGKCLRFTIGVFARELMFEDRLYYGTHYFKNNFKDPYIDESDLQESSYHLEATTGLILGLLHFANAHPEHRLSPDFREEALALWAGVQRYTREWGFPYSSQRIHGLSTQLSSSTAAIWFIDVHQYLEAQDRVEDRPLKSYAKTVDQKTLSEERHAVAHFADDLFKALNQAKKPHAIKVLQGSPVSSSLRRLLAPYGPAYARHDGDLHVELPDGVRYVVPESPDDHHRVAKFWSHAPVNPFSVSIRMFEEAPEPMLLGNLPGGHFFLDEDEQQFEQVFEVRASTTRPWNYFVVVTVQGAGQVLRVGAAPLNEQGLARISYQSSNSLKQQLPVARIFRWDDRELVAASAPFETTDELGTRWFLGKANHWYLHQTLEEDVELTLLSKEPHQDPVVVGHVRANGERPIEQDLVVSFFDDGAAMTLIEDQALSVFISATRGKEYGSAWGIARDRALALVHTIQRDAEGNHQFPLVVDTRTQDATGDEFDLGSQMLAIYALSWVLNHRFSASAEDVRDDEIQQIQTAVLNVLNTLERIAWIKQGRLQGLYAAAEAPRDSLGQAKFATLEDNVLAYFALDEAGHALRHLPDIPNHLWYLRGQIYDALDALAWKHQPETPHLVFPREGSAGFDFNTDPVASLSLYALFLSRTRDYDRLIQVRPLLNRFDQDTSTIRKTMIRSMERVGSPLPHRWAHLFGISLARRAFSAQDPREDAFAYHDFQRFSWAYNVDASNMTATYLAGMLLLQYPRDFLGIGAGPFAFSPTSADLGDLLDTNEINLSRARTLRDLYVSQVGALLLSDYAPFRYDAIVSQLAKIRSSFDQVSRSQEPQTWPDAFEEDRDRWIQQTLYELEHLCELPEPLQDDYKPMETLERYLGVRCEVAEMLFRDLNQARGHGQHQILLIEGDKNPIWWTHFLRQIHSFQPLRIRPPGSRINFSSLFYVGEHPPADLPPETSVAEAQTVMRAHLPNVFENAIDKNAIEPKFELSGFDWIDALNPASPSYWTQSSVGFRVALKHKERIYFEVSGYGTPAPAYPLAPEAAKNVRILRQALNTHVDGDLTRVAAWSKIPLPLLHPVMRTGEITEEAFDTVWAKSLGLDAESEASLKEALHLGPMSPH